MSLIARVSTVENRTDFTRSWYPDIEPRMMYVTPQDKSKLVKYILHAKHKKITGNFDKPDWFLSEEWEETLEAKAE